MYKDIYTGDGTKYKDRFIDYFLRILKGKVGEIILKIIEEDVRKFYEKADKLLVTKE